MKPAIFFLLAVLLALPLAANGAPPNSPPVRSEDGNDLCRFVDEDGDGFNDLAPDADGDGIPNSLDPDYEKPEDGEGLMNRWAHAYGELFRRYFGVDLFSAMSGYNYGPNEGMGTGVLDGTGFGPGLGAGGSTVDNSGSGTVQDVEDRRSGRKK